MKFKLAIVLVAFSFIFISCGEKTDIVESGTYQGIVNEVEPAKTEIYVKIEDDRILELYFNEGTSLTRNGENIDFSALEEGQSVEVEVKRNGKRLDPISVKILD